MPHYLGLQSSLSWKYTAAEESLVTDTLLGVLDAWSPAVGCGTLLCPVLVWGLADETTEGDQKLHMNIQIKLNS